MKEKRLNGCNKNNNNKVKKICNYILTTIGIL